MVFEGVVERAGEYMFLRVVDRYLSCALHHHHNCERSLARSLQNRKMAGATANGTNGTHASNGASAVLPKKKILLNAFDMSTVGHLSPGQWKNPKDRSATKRKLDYWIDLAKLLDRGGINALFLADTYGGYDTYEGKLDDCIRRAAQWPMTDPTIVC